MDSTVTHVNITAAALLTEFLLSIIMFIGAMILIAHINEDQEHVHRIVTFSRLSRYSRLSPALILISSLICIGVLVFSEDFVGTWKPVFGVDRSISGISAATAVHVMFLTNILCLSLLVRYTGGSYSSSFSPIYFTIPALALFLREPYGWVIAYVVLVALLFTLQVRTPLIFIERGSDSDALKRAYWFISIACFILTTIIGYVTRPL